MTIHLYKSTDIGAPVLSGQAGELISLLDALLVYGYGTGLNAKAPAGWTKPFAASGKAAYRMPAASNHHFFRIADDGTLTGGDRTASIECFADMSSITEGTDQTAARFVSKSISADATARAWRAVTDELFVYLAIATAGGDGYNLYMLGETGRLNAGDVFNTLVAAQTSNVNFGATGQAYHAMTRNAYLGEMLRDFTGTPGYREAHSMSMVVAGNPAVNAQLPSQVLGGQLLCPAYVTDSQLGYIEPRGHLPGGYYGQFKEADAAVSGDVKNDYVGLDTHDLMLIRAQTGSATAPFYIDLTGPWR